METTSHVDGRSTPERKSRASQKARERWGNMTEEQRKEHGRRVREAQEKATFTRLRSSLTEGTLPDHLLASLSSHEIFELIKRLPLTRELNSRGYGLLLGQKDPLLYGSPSEYRRTN